MKRLIPYAGRPRRSTGELADRDLLVREYAATYKAAGLDPNGLGDGGPSAAALKALLARRQAAERRDLTGRLLGDPPPGRSALDRRLGAAR